jgi:hypothetical protein
MPRTQSVYEIKRPEVSTLEGSRPEQRQMGQISAYGITATLATGWDGAIYQDDDPEMTPTPTLHAASFTLPADDQEATFGDYAIDQLGNGGIFVSLPEYLPDTLTDRADINPTDPGVFGGSMLQPANSLYEAAGLPGPYSTADFDGRAVIGAPPASNPGAVQSFFRASGRIFCIYAVIGNKGASTQVAAVNNLINTLRVTTSIQVWADCRIGFSPTPNFSSGSPTGNFLGHGTGTCGFSAVNGDFDETVGCTVNVGGTYSGGACSDDFILDGTYSLTLDDGRSLSAPMELVVPGMNSQSAVAEISYDNQLASIPAPCILNGGTCSAMTTLRVNLAGVFRESRLA